MVACHSSININVYFSGEGTPVGRSVLCSLNRSGTKTAKCVTHAPCRGQAQASRVGGDLQWISKLQSHQPITHAATRLDYNTDTGTS